MRLTTLLAVGSIAYLALRAIGRYGQPERDRLPSPPGGAGAGTDGTAAGERPAPAPESDWDIVDEASDESFPASDPPARY